MTNYHNSSDIGDGLRIYVFFNINTHIIKWTFR